MEGDEGPPNGAAERPKKERNFLTLELKEPNQLDNPQPLLVVQSPKTPTLSRKLKAVSLDSDSQKQKQLEARDVFSMPNTPKKQTKLKVDLEDGQKLTPTLNSNLKRFASNNSISGSQTLKTLPEVMMIHDFSETVTRTEPLKIKAKGLLERRGSNASLTIDLSNVDKPVPISRLNAAKSVSNLNLTTFGGANKCECKEEQEIKKPNLTQLRETDRRKPAETCGNCTIYESVASKSNVCKSKYKNLHKKCNCICNFKCGRKSLSNENLYVPPCNFCQTSVSPKCGGIKHCRGHRRACYPRQPDVESSQVLSDDFKLHLQNVQYLQTAGSVLTVADLKSFSEMRRVPKLQAEFWEVPLNLQEKCIVSGSQGKNRYRGILPNEHSRVHLGEEQPYIHANYIKGPDYTETAYIATQGPMEHTCEDFWEMVWLTNSNGIVMLTQLVEKGRGKCELYFPLGKRPDVTGKSYYVMKTVRIADKFTFDRNPKTYEEEFIKHEEKNEVTYGKYLIRHISKETFGDCIIRQFELERRVGETMEKRFVTHYWYPHWQDHKMADPHQVLQMALHVLDFMDANRKRHAEMGLKSDQVVPQSGEQSPLLASHKKEKMSAPPLIVHCSAGIGRTGCFLAILNGIQQLRTNHNVDVLAILCSLRLHRGGMVQTAEQYELIHRVLSLYTESM